MELRSRLGSATLAGVKGASDAVHTEPGSRKGATHRRTLMSAQRTRSAIEQPRRYTLTVHPALLSRRRASTVFFPGPENDLPAGELKGAGAGERLLAAS